MGSIQDRVKAIVVDKLGVEEDKVVPEATFIDDLNADSLDLVELIMAFEEKFSAEGKQLEISDEAAEQIITVQDAVNYLVEHGVQDE